MSRKILPYHWRNRIFALRLWLRRFSAARRALPGAIIIGAQKAGTSTLHRNLLQHPEIVTPIRKETRFFDFNHGRGEAYYRAYFPVQGNHRTVGIDASPDYMIHPHVPTRIADMIPDVRLIAILRSPVARAYSHYQHSVRRGYEELSFEDAIDAEPARLAGEVERIAANPLHSLSTLHRYSYLWRGHYAEHLERFLKVIPRDRLLIVTAEDYFADPSRTADRVFAFLGVSPFQIPTEHRKKHIGEYEPMSNETRRRLDEYFAPHESRLAALLREVA